MPVVYAQLQCEWTHVRWTEKPGSLVRIYRITRRIYTSVQSKSNKDAL